MLAGILSVVHEGDDVLVRAVCDEELGFVPVFGEPEEMR